MASLVANNPYDMTQQKFAGTGDVSGQITGGARNGMNWDFMDQQGKVLTSVPYQDFVNNYQSDGYGAVRQGINAVNGVSVYDFNNQGSAPATSSGISDFDKPMAQLPAATPAATKTGLVGGAIAGSPGAALVTSQAPVTGAAAQTYTPQTSIVDRATETAAGQVNSLLANDNPLLQRARTLARQGMAQRGLVNSSMAQGAGVAAMVDRITPIAQQDAQTYSNRSLANLDAANEAGQFNVNQNNQLVSQNLNIAANKDLATAQQNFQTAQADLDRAFQATQQDKSIKAQTDLQNAQFSFQQAQSQLDRAQQLMISNAQVASNERLTLAQIDATAKNLNTSNQAQMEQLKTQINNNQTEAGKNYAATLTLNATNQINAILADGNLDAAAKQGAIDNLIKTTNTSLQWASTFYNTTLPTYTAPGGTNTSITPATKYSQQQANQALADLKVTEPGTGYADVVKAGLNLGFTRAQIDAAYAANNISTGGTLAPAAQSSASNTASSATNDVAAPAPAAAAAAPTRTEVIKDYVSANLSNPAAISAAAIERGVSLNELASSVGVSVAEARAYFANAGVAIP